MCSHEASPQYVCGCVESDAQVGGMPYHREGTCRAEEALAVHPALRPVERGYQEAGGENSSPYDDFVRQGTLVEVLTVGGGIGGGGRRGKRYCWSRVVACD